MRRILFFVVALFAILSFQKNEDRYDLIIKKGHVINPRNGIDRVLDVAVLDDKIIRVDTDIPATNGSQIVDAAGVMMEGTTQIEPEATIRAGKIVWDLNGIGASLYDGW